ncbi:UNVERIFIED_CONTAM: hypothetical protein PYX00_010096 [Menopon gallinae]|uniref:CHHC U11-48K-type domain-containing protein n=1 Tax=Menopon gallinae TaxID=328185 RepID=A0AAW2HE12_9NEOP
MVQCPYNSYHIILKSRFSAHLCKCRRQYSGSDFTVCPFNATHNVLAPELQVNP